jgi:hypothetical protein
MCTLLYMSVVTKSYFVILCTYTLDLLTHALFCNGNHNTVSKLEFFSSARNFVTMLELKMVYISYSK